MAAPPSWIFTTSEFGTFWHNGRLMLKLCIKFGSNVSYYHLYCRPFIPVVRLMTSRELTSGFDFCIFQSNSVLLAFYEIQDGCRPASWEPLAQTKSHSWCVSSVNSLSRSRQLFSSFKDLNFFCRSGLKVLFTPPKCQFLWV